MKGKTTISSFWQLRNLLKLVMKSNIINLSNQVVGDDVLSTFMRFQSTKKCLLTHTIPFSPNLFVNSFEKLTDWSCLQA